MWSHLWRRFFGPRFPDSAPMARVPSARVTLDLPGLAPKRVRVSAFELDIRPVNNREWLAFCQATRTERAPWMYQPDFADPEQAVVGITLAEAKAYARWVGKRLPREAEWLAAYGNAPYPWGTQAPTAATADFAHNTRARSKRQAPAFDTRLEGAGPYGHRDLLGHLWEHLEPHPSTETSIARGGFWGSPQLSRELRLVLRPQERSSGVGLRCAR